MPTVRCDRVAAHVFRVRGERVEFLLIRRAAGDYLGGTWQSVYGGVRPGEAAWQAALREVREETGLAPVRFYYTDTVETFYMQADDVIQHCPCFAAEAAPDAAVTLNDEHDAFEWLEPEPAMQRYMWPGQRRAVREILSEIIAAGPAKEYLRIPI